MSAHLIATLSQRSEALGLTTRILQILASGPQAILSAHGLRVAHRAVRAQPQMGGRHRRGRSPARTRALPRPRPHIRASLRQKRTASLLPGLVDAESAASDHLAVCARVLCAFVELHGAAGRM